jgi:hypothetical protein
MERAFIPVDRSGRIDSCYPPVLQSAISNNQYQMFVWRVNRARAWPLTVPVLLFFIFMLIGAMLLTFGGSTSSILFVLSITAFVLAILALLGFGAIIIIQLSTANVQKHLSRVCQKAQREFPSTVWSVEFKGTPSIPIGLLTNTRYSSGIYLCVYVPQEQSFYVPVSGIDQFVVSTLQPPDLTEMPPSYYEFPPPSSIKS